MATPPLSLEIVQGATTWTFLVPPRFEPRREARFKEASNPPQVEEVLDIWDLPDALLVSSNGTLATLWTDLAAFRALQETRATPIASVTVKDSGGTTRWALSSATSYEQIRVDAWEAGSTSYEEVRPAVWRTVIPVRLQVSAVLKRPDTNGVVRWDQRVSYSYDEGGLQIVEWDTEISTLEGTSAATKVQTLGLIPVASFGDSYSYLTNGDAGVETTILDADETNSRTPTRARGVCRMRQWGVNVGTSGPGVSPSLVSYEVRSKQNVDELVLVYTASATGPGAEAWVRSRIPTGIVISEAEYVDEQARRTFSAVWTQRVPGSTTPDGDGVQRTYRVQVSGGSPAPSFEPAMGGYLPVRFTSAIMPWTVTVDISVEGTGTALRSQMQFPALLRGPLVLDPDASSEDADPYVVAFGQESGSHRYRREARLVYRSAEPPPLDVATQLQGTTVHSYYLG